MTEEKMVYIARENCGCITGFVTDSPKISRKDLAKDVSDFIKSGRSVEKVTLEEAKRQGFDECPKDKTKHWDIKVCRLCDRNMK